MKVTTAPRRFTWRTAAALVAIFFAGAALHGLVSWMLAFETGGGGFFVLYLLLVVGVLFVARRRIFR